MQTKEVLSVHMPPDPCEAVSCVQASLDSCRTEATGGETGHRRARWYVAQTHPRKELAAVEHLTRQGFATFLPRFRVGQIRGNRRETVLKPVFPGYVFVAFDASVPAWTSINATRGVRRLIGSAHGAPRPVPTKAMDLIMKRCDGEIMLELLNELKRGDLVQINTGALAQRIAKVDRLEEGDRIALLFEIMGSEQVILVSRGAIGPITITKNAA